MNSNYILTSNGGFISVDELYHHGILGMKWGVRRYQNEDGTLTDAGKKRYLNPDGTFNKKGKKKFGDSVKTAETVESASKTSSSETPKSIKTEEYDMGLLSDKEVLDLANRMNNEERLKDLLTKRGYNVSLDTKNEVDREIEALAKEKTLLQLRAEVNKMTQGKTETEKQIEILQQKRDITKLEKEIRDNTPKKESKLSKFMNSPVGQTLSTQLVKSGENVLTNLIKSKYLAEIEKSKNGNNDNKPNDNKPNDNNKNNKSNKNKDNVDAGVKAVADDLRDTLGKEAKQVADSYQKQKAKQEAKEAKQAEKQAAKEAKKAAKETAKAEANYEKSSSKDTVFEGEVVDTPNYNSSSSNSSKSSNAVYDMYKGSDGVYRYANTSATSLATTKNTSSGKSWVSGLLSSPVSSSSSSSSGLSVSSTSSRIKSMKNSGNYTNAEIAEKLGISESAVGYYLYGGGS